MRKKILLVGASTGGPSIIKELLSSINTLNSTIVIAQHMKEEVLPFFIKDMQESLHIKVKPTPTYENFHEPSIIICSCSSIISVKDNGYIFETCKSEQYYTPDINHLFKSFVPLTSVFDISALIMTGIGSDGVDGAEELKNSGATIYAQDEASSPVYGMPKAAYERGIVDKTMNLDDLKLYLQGL